MLPLLTPASLPSPPHKSDPPVGGGDAEGESEEALEEDQSERQGKVQSWCHLMLLCSKFLFRFFYCDHLSSSVQP